MSIVSRKTLLYVVFSLLFLCAVLMMIHNRDENFLKYVQSVHLGTSNCETNKKREELEPEKRQQTDWKVVDVAKMTAKEIIDYLRFTNRSSCALIHDFGGVMNSNPAGLDGQKAICLDPGKAPVSKYCNVYSFGINNEWSFDDSMDKYGCQVFAFDPTLGLNDFDRSKNIHFYNLGLGNEDGIRNGWKVRKLSTIHKMLTNTSKHGADAVIDYLKIDIEYDEWLALPDIISSGMIYKVRQLGVEIHLPKVERLEDYRKLVQTLKDIEDTGMIRFDSKYNPWFMDTIPALNYKGSRGFEIAWYRLI